MRNPLCRILAAAVVVVAGLAVAPERAAAQETLTPVFKAPYRAFRSHELAGNVSFPEGGDLGIEASYTYGAGRNDFGIRGGFVTLDGDAGTQIRIGGSFRTRILDASEKFPLDGALTLGAGLGLGDGTDFIALPVGLSLGRRILLEGSNTSFVPYVHPVLVPTFIDNDLGDDSDIGFALGLGVNINFSEQYQIRVSGGIGDYGLEGISLGLAILR